MHGELKPLYVYSFLPAVLKHVAFEANPTGCPVVEACNWLLSHCAEIADWRAIFFNTCSRFNYNVIALKSARLDRLAKKQRLYVCFVADRSYVDLKDRA